MDIAFNPVNNKLYVANLFNDNVSVIDTSTETVSTTLNVGTDPLGVGINTNNGDIYVASSGSIQYPFLIAQCSGNNHCSRWNQTCIGYLSSGE